MCRNIKTLFNFEPPATDDEIRAAALQFVRKLSGFNSPSQANRVAFDRAVEEVAKAATALIGSLVTNTGPRDRDVEAQRAKARNIELPLVISDHADWDELTATLGDVGAPEIWVTHGREEALVHYATASGLSARALALTGFGEEEGE